MAFFSYSFGISIFRASIFIFTRGLFFILLYKILGSIWKHYFSFVFFLKLDLPSLFKLPWKYWIFLLIFQMKIWSMGTICKLFCLFKSYHWQYIFDLCHFFSCVLLIPLVIKTYPGVKETCGKVYDYSTLVSP